MGIGGLIGWFIGLVIKFALGYYLLIIYFKPKTTNIFKKIPEVGRFLEKHRWIYLVFGIILLVSFAGDFL